MIGSPYCESYRPIESADDLTRPDPGWLAVEPCKSCEHALFHREGCEVGASTFNAQMSQMAAGTTEAASRSQRISREQWTRLVLEDSQVSEPVRPPS